MSLNGADARAVGDQPIDRDSVENLPATLHHGGGGLFPHLPWTVFGVEKALDERGLRLLLADLVRLTARYGDRLPRRVDECLQDRQSLDPLRAPFGADAVARQPPHFLCI